MITGWECEAAQGAAYAPARGAGGWEAQVEQQAGEDRTVCAWRYGQECGRVYITGKVLYLSWPLETSLLVLLE